MNTDAVTATGYTVKPEHIADFTGNFDTREGWKAAYQAREREAHDLSEHIIALGQQITQLRTSHAELVKALEPFANYACSEPCDCHNCRARTALATAKGLE